MSAASRRRGAQAQRRAQSQRNRKDGSTRLKLIAIAAATALGAVAILIFVGGLFRDNGSGAIAQRTAPTSGFVLGSADAPVLIQMWEDFQCPICKQANASVLQQIEADYVNTGKVRIQYRQFPFLGNESTWAAEASQAAADQGKFWEFEAAAFAAQKAENSGALSKDNLKKIAQSIGLDMMMFNQSFDNGTHKESVQAEKKIGEGMGVNATPTFFVDGKQVKDWRDYTTFKAMIESALTAAGKS